jgi:two-component system, LytTR family, response regulator
MKACIVDDEKKGRDSLQNLLHQYCSEVEVIGQADSIESAYQFITKNKPALVFLDVEMPQGSGFELLKRFEKVPFKTIFVTAHQHYAIKAIRFAAIDYLLKPVDVDELIAAVDNAKRTLSSNYHQHYSALFENIENSRQGKIAIPVRDGVAFVSPSDIIRLQADGPYTHIFTLTDKFTATKNIKEYEEMLHDYNFFRAHHSHLINLKYVKRFSRLDGYSAQMTDGSVVEVSRRKKEQFLELMNL